MTDLQREREIENAASWNAELRPDDATYLLAELKKARERPLACRLTNCGCTCHEKRGE